MVSITLSGLYWVVSDEMLCLRGDTLTKLASNRMTPIDGHEWSPPVASVSGVAGGEYAAAS